MSDNNEQSVPNAGVPPMPQRPALPDGFAQARVGSPGTPHNPAATAPTAPLPPDVLERLRADAQLTTPIEPMRGPSGPSTPPTAVGYGAATQPTHHTPWTTPSVANANQLPPGAPIPMGQGSFGQPQQVPSVSSTTAPKARRRVGGSIALLTAAALIGAGAGFGGSWAWQTWGPNDARPVAESPTGGTITVNNPGSVTETTAIAAEALPSVVTINVSTNQTGGSGSGVILSDDGYVLTNTHVVTLDGATGAADVSVTTADGKIYSAEVVGTDPIYDLAVIKMKDASGLKPVTWGDSSKLNVGDRTVALGAPLGLANTVTEGIVSNLNRSIQVASSAAPDSGDTPEGDQGSQQGGPFTFDVPGQSQSTAKQSIFMSVIQTDAAINPGNSGGALVNSKGELIGINVAIATAGGSSGQAGSIGVGFSIPSNIAQRISEEIISNGSATHGLLGASVAPAAAMKGATDSGAYIAEIVPGGAAEKAGLKKGDVVTKLGDARIFDSNDLTAQVRALAAGSKTTLTYVRDGQSYEADVTLGSL